MPVYALNLFNLADNDDYRAYSRVSAEAIAKHGGTVVAIGGFREEVESSGVAPRRAMIVVEWPSQERFEAFRFDREFADLHPLRENGTRDYIWWAFDKFDDLRPLFADQFDTSTG